MKRIKLPNTPIELLTNNAYLRYHGFYTLAEETIWLERARAREKAEREAHWASLCECHLSPKLEGKRVCYRCLSGYRALWKKVYSSPEQYRRRNRAQHLAETALLSGALSKGVCAVCGNPQVHMYHEDYDKPLEVRWLCGKHCRHLKVNPDTALEFI